MTPEPSAAAKRLEPGDRIRLFGGYDMEPRWLGDRDCYYATVLGFFDNRIEKRTGDERLSAAIEFDQPLSFEGLEAKFGVILGRWEGQRWERKGVVHVCLVEREISDSSQITKDNSRWMESHASYECLER
jgi:hypothetical protein